jgi:hypothetical protein
MGNDEEPRFRLSEESFTFVQDVEGTPFGTVRVYRRNSSPYDFVMSWHWPDNMLNEQKQKYNDQVAALINNPPRAVARLCGLHQEEAVGMCRLHSAEVYQAYHNFSL